MTERTLPALSAAQQAEQMIGRGQELETLHAALRNDPSDRAFRVVLVYGRGGLGKTRLLEEALRAARHPNWAPRPASAAWTDLNGAIISDLVDLVDLRLHDRYQFVAELRESLKLTAPALSYPQFDKKENELAVLKGHGVQFQSISTAEELTSHFFVDDLRDLAADKRVVFLIDTVEQLNNLMSGWLLKQGERLNKDLLRESDLSSRTHQWLAWLVRKSGLENVTLVLAGREGQSRQFFDAMRAAMAAADGRVEKIEIPLSALDRKGTQEYFATFQQEWEERQASEPGLAYIADHFKLLAEDSRRSDAIWLLTGGVPVRLALYAQLVIENPTIPPPLQDPFETVWEKSGGRHHALSPEEMVKDPTPELQQLQWEVEDEIIRLLFARPTELRSRVLQLLARAPRGLTAEQIHYCLDSNGRSPEAFQPDQDRLDQLNDILGRIAGEYLGKRRRSGEEFRARLGAGRPSAAPFRLALQDELYGIFAEHMALLSEPLTEGTEPIRRRLSDREKDNYRRRRREEQRARQTLYRQLSAWAEFKLNQYRALKQERLDRDERDLELRLDLEDARSFRFPSLGFDDAEQRQAINEAIATYEVERMVYMILLDPERNLNTEYINLEDDRPKAGRQSLDFWAQAEMWRVLSENALMKFVEFHPRDQARARGETPIEVLRRFAAQEDVTRWIKRFTLRFDLERAIEFGQDVEDAIETLPRRTKAERNNYHSWNHSLARGERVIWTRYARILRSQDVEGAVREIYQTLERLKPLQERSVAERVYGRGLYDEHGFAAGPDKPEHPGAVRLRRLLSHGYNWLGYGHRVLGRMEDAVESYGLALNYVRDDVGLMKAHRAAVLNNLSRALSELGWHSTPVCLDGLRIRRELTEEVPLAQSYNTLALIYDDMGRYEDAPVLAAKALAYSRRAEAKRQVGLCLRQMAESLRHLAIRMQTGQLMAATPDQLYTAANDLLREAHVLFTEVKEPSRLIEVLIEWGSLYRDRMEPDSEGNRPRLWANHYREALHLLGEADELASEHGRHYHMDIHINVARVHYYAGDLDKAEAELDAILRESYVKEHLIRSTRGRARIPDPSRDKRLRDRAWTFRYLSTLQMIRGWIALARFQQRVSHWKEQEQAVGDEATRRERVRDRVAGDREARRQLQLGAEAYALGIAYAQLYSPRSRTISTLENDLYDRLRAFNQRELTTFQDGLNGLGRRYAGLDSLEGINNILHKFLGFPEAAQPKERRT